MVFFRDFELEAVLDWSGPPVLALAPILGFAPVLARTPALDFAPVLDLGPFLGLGLVFDFGPSFLGRSPILVLAWDFGFPVEFPAEGVSRPEGPSVVDRVPILPDCFVRP